VEVVHGGLVAGLGVHAVVVGTLSLSKIVDLRLLGGLLALSGLSQSSDLSLFRGCNNISLGLSQSSDLSLFRGCNNISLGLGKSAGLCGSLDSSIYLIFRGSIDDTIVVGEVAVSASAYLS